MTADAKLTLYSFSLEAAAIASLFKGPYFMRVSTFLTLHSAACFISSAPVWRLMPERYRHPRARSLALVFALLFTVSIAGFAALVFINAYLLRKQKKLDLIKAEVVSQERLSPDALAMPTIKMGEGALRALSSGNFTSQESRMRTVMMLNEITAEMPKHVSLLKESIRSQDDSVRMFSFGMIDSMEKRINDQIHSKLEQFRASPSQDEKADAARELASLYWEYVYTGLADKEYRDIMMRESENYARLALRHRPSDPLLLSLLGRMALARKRYEEAMQRFKEAMASSPNPDKFLPYIAEIHYLRRDYASVRATFAKHSGFTHDPSLEPLVGLWTAE